ncbi:hypothetical protein IGI04_042788 [Brassica rapa subsp. trilocularis]|uniref:Uncharacterized protein n=1 Tax=Brassica rapa subsp. trilocularis TaxID=1813537 RepID=A0ABQ7KKA2_BRACM|nr:hypothetical protein IGI04_042788 [Brassica rapa subsp. trilocularis]
MVANSEERLQWLVCADHEAVCPSLFIREANRLGSMVKDEEAMSKAVSSVEVVGERLKHPHVVPATRW